MVTGVLITSVTIPVVATISVFTVIDCDKTEVSPALTAN